jgi:hypothetical protein
MRNQGGNAGRQGLMTTQTRRIDELATSKAIPQGFLEDRFAILAGHAETPDDSHETD